MRIHVRTGADAEGRLLAHEVDMVIDTGAYVTFGPAVLETALEHAAGPYRIANLRTRGRCVFTNNGVSGAFRGFGVNEIATAVETQINRLGEKTGLGPLDIRRLNLRGPDDLGHFGQKLAPSDRVRDIFEAAAASDLWRKSRGPIEDGRKLIGVGLAVTMAVNGLGSTFPDPGGGRLRLALDGKIEAAFGIEECGQGAVAVIQEIVSVALGCDRADVRPVLGDTARAPISGSSSASRTTSMIWRTGQEAGPALRALLLEAAAAALLCPAHDLKIGSGGVYDRRQNRSDVPILAFAELASKLGEAKLPVAIASFEFPKTGYTGANAHFLYCSGATVVRVAVDRATGAVELLDLDQHTAAGPVVDPAGYLGQIEGAGVQGMGFTLCEDVVIKAGTYLTRDLDSYMIPSIADAPHRMRVFAMEELDHDDSYGPRGIGELGIGAVTPAIIAAVAEATGSWLNAVPLSPEQILSAMGGMSISDIDDE